MWPGPGRLLSRGLPEEDVTRFGALPRTKQERAVLAGILNDYVCADFPEYAKFHSGAEVIGAPRFWQPMRSGVSSSAKISLTLVHIRDRVRLSPILNKQRLLAQVAQNIRSMDHGAPFSDASTNINGAEDPRLLINTSLATVR